jgi:hypothetical protein
MKVGKIRTPEVACGSVPQKKKCSCCGRPKDLVEFYRDRHQRSGLSCSCKKCQRSARTPAIRQCVPIEKNCPKCGKTKVHSYFRRSRFSSTGLSSWCKDCSRICGLLRKYGITPQAYLKQLATQDGVCAICHQPNVRGRPLVVDHDHASQAFRGLLCDRCNLVLGYIEKNPDVLVKIPKYLASMAI